MKDEHIVRLKVRSVSRTHEELTSAIGLVPDKTWRIGDFRSVTTIKEECNGWVLDSGLSRADEISAHIDRLIFRIAANVPNIKRLAASEDIEISIVMYAKSAKAGMNLSKQHLEFIAALGGTLDVDLYFTSEDS